MKYPVEILIYNIQMKIRLLRLNGPLLVLATPVDSEGFKRVNQECRAGALA